MYQNTHYLCLCLPVSPAIPSLTSSSLYPRPPCGWDYIPLLAIHTGLTSCLWLHWESTQENALKNRKALCYLEVVLRSPSKNTAQNISKIKQDSLKEIDFLQYKNRQASQLEKIKKSVTIWPAFKVCISQYYLLLAFWEGLRMDYFPVHSLLLGRKTHNEYRSLLSTWNFHLENNKATTEIIIVDHVLFLWKPQTKVPYS